MDRADGVLKLPACPRQEQVEGRGDLGHFVLHCDIGDLCIRMAPNVDGPLGRSYGADGPVTEVAPAQKAPMGKSGEMASRQRETHAWGAQVLASSPSVIWVTCQQCYSRGWQHNPFMHPSNGMVKIFTHLPTASAS